MYNYRARFYDEETGQFYGVDQLAQFHSPYSYVGGNPVSFVDPDWQWAWLISAGVNYLWGALENRFENGQSWGDSFINSSFVVGGSFTIGNYETAEFNPVYELDNTDTYFHYENELQASGVTMTAQGGFNIYDQTIINGLTSSIFGYTNYNMWNQDYLVESIFNNENWWASNSISVFQNKSGNPNAVLQAFVKALANLGDAEAERLIVRDYKGKKAIPYKYNPKTDEYSPVRFSNKTDLHQFFSSKELSEKHFGAIKDPNTLVGVYTYYDPRGPSWVSTFDKWQVAQISPPVGFKNGHVITLQNSKQKHIAWLRFNSVDDRSKFLKRYYYDRIDKRYKYLQRKYGIK